MITDLRNISSVRRNSEFTRIISDNPRPLGVVQTCCIVNVVVQDDHPRFENERVNYALLVRALQDSWLCWQAPCIAVGGVIPILVQFGLEDLVQTMSKTETGYILQNVISLRHELCMDFGALRLWLEETDEVCSLRGPKLTLTRRLL